MSDFDKEAERQRLREKYEAEREDREATQHMSELLLKGATMTNSHCGTCGDPIFRYDGQEFCPSCHGDPKGGAAAQAQQADAQAQQADAQAQQADVQAQQQDTQANQADTQTEQQDAEVQQANAQAQQADARLGAGERDDATTTASVDSAASVDASVDSPSDDARDTGGDASTTRRASNEQPSSRSTEDAPADHATGHVDDVDAVANVQATVERFAAAAADTDDPERAREYLAVVRDATETLRTLRGDGR